MLLSVVTWTGADAASSTKWSDGGNWETGSPPGIGDTAMFNANNPAGTPDVSTVDMIFPIVALKTMGAWSGTIEVKNALTLTAGFTLAGGDLEVDNTMLVSGTSRWTGGTLTGGGTVSNSGTLNIDPGANGSVVIGATGAATMLTLNNLAETDLVSGFLSMEGHATINNSGTFNILNDTNIYASFASSLDYGIINNTGTFNKSSATLLAAGTSEINDHFNNNGGTINVTMGVLKLTNGGVCTGGTFNASAMATLDLEGAPGSGTSVYAGGYSGTGAGSVLWGFPLQIAAAGASFNFAPGLLKWEGSTITGGVLTNEGSMTVVGGGSLTGGTLNNEGEIDLPGTASINVGSPGTTLNNLSTGIINLMGDLTGDATFTGFGGGGIVTNIGTLEKTKGTGTSTFGVPFNNLSNGLIDGKIIVQTGTIRFDAAGTSTGGTFTVAGGATLDLTGGGSTATLNGSYTGSGAGTVTFGFTIDVSTAGATFNFPAGLFQWKTGLIKGSGGLTNVGSITVDTSSGAPALASGAVLNNAGTIDLVGAGSWDIGFFFAGAATLNNLAMGLIDVQGDASVANGSFPDVGVFNNSGTIQKSAGSATTSVSTALNNTGIVLAHSGTLSFDASVAQLSGSTLSGGTWDVDSGSTLTFSFVGPIATNGANVTLTGPGSTFSNFSGLATNTGTLDLEAGQIFTTGGDFTNSGALIVGAASALDVTGQFTQTAAGTFTTKVAGEPATGQFGRVVATGPAALAGTLAVRTVNGFAFHTGAAYKVITYPSETGTPTLDGGGMPLSEQINPTDLTIAELIPTSLSAVSGHGTYSGTATLTATLGAGGAPLASKAITFTLTAGGTTLTVGTATSNASGVATLSNVSLAGFNAGAYPGAVGAHFAGDATVAGSTASGDLTVGQAKATLALSDLDFTFDSASHAATVTTNPAGLGGVSVTYTQNNVAVAAPTDAGSYTVTVTLSNPNFQATPVTGTLTIHPATPTPTPPHATGLAGVGRSKKGLTAISVAFNESLNPGSAVNVGLYSVLGAVKKHGKTVYSKGIAIRGLSYDGNAYTVTINLAKPYKGMLQVTVHGGIMAANGLTSHGDFTAVVK